ncbi:MAG: aldolase/citrate lyase family protein [Pseudomonadota bacterium]|nr:aldolase/citrate lyase family protein [Pseudomonadota bacterium]
MTATIFDNPFKRALRDGRAQIGLWQALASSYSAELCATAGFDWLLLDGEHAPNDLRSVLAQLQALAAYPSVHPVVRPVSGDAALIKQLLDVGARNLLVPMVESPSQAEQIVRAVRYPPAGIRGVGAGIARASRWNGIEGYLDNADEQICVLVQVESITGLAAIDAIAAVPGVDGVFMGPADLAASMGRRGRSGDTEVVSATESGLKAIVRRGKAAGILCVDETLARRYLDSGFSFIAVGVDTSLLATAARGLAARFKRATDVRE